MEIRVLLIAALATLMAVPVVVADDGIASQSELILINNVRPWDGVSEAADSVNILVKAGRIEAVTSAPAEVAPQTIVMDGGGRAVMGSIEVGGIANLLVINGNPANGITTLAEPSSAFLIVKDGLIRADSPLETSVASTADAEKYRVVDAARFKVVTLPAKPWYAYNNENFSIAFGGGVLLDRTEFNQGGNSADELGNLDEFNTGEVRAMRFGIGGAWRMLERPWFYTLVGANRAFDQGFDTNQDEEWLWYDWAVGVQVLGGALLKIGKQKENFSHDRLTVLVDQQFMERAMVLDTLLPSRNTGMTLANSALQGRMTWSVGAFTDMLGDRDPPFEDSDQYAVRVTGLPFVRGDDETILHAGIGYRYSDVDSGVMRFRGTPEAFFSPDFVDTGEYAASNASWLSLEAGWLQGPVWLMSEYVGTQVSSNEAGNPDFDGFHLTGAWAITGERRVYDHKKGVFGKLTPNHDVDKGGVGAWEVVARYSEVDLTDGLIDGGEMSRISVGLNWYANPSFKATAQYGWVDLDRFGISSTTNILQFRMTFLLGM